MMVPLRYVRGAALTAGVIGGLSAVGYGFLSSQSRMAALVIGEPEEPPHNADGQYRPDGAGPLHHDRQARPLRFAVIGDSAAAGLGVDFPDQLPGVLLARGLAEETDREVALTTYAVCGATTGDVAAQVDNALVEPPDVALIIVGANDISARMPVHVSAELLATAVTRLREAGVAVVVGTCPDLSAIRPIPQPLRTIASVLSRQLARAQRAAVASAGGVPVPLGDLLSPEFRARPNDLFSADRFHPNAAGYEAAASVLLAPLTAAVTVAKAPKGIRRRPARRRLVPVPVPFAVPSN
jgi:lysophospholipase L1-like esterase